MNLKKCVSLCSTVFCLAFTNIAWAQYTNAEIPENENTDAISENYSKDDLDGVNILYDKADSLTIETFLKAEKENDKATAATFARKFIGIPYVAHTLEGNEDECLVVNTRQMDCTTLVETATALMLCHQRKMTSFYDYCRMLLTIRYHKGRIDGYASRLHYFTEWIIDNEQKKIVDEVQKSSAPFNATQTIQVGFMSEHPEYYEALKRQPKLIMQIKDNEKRINGLIFRYIPKQDVGSSAAMREVVSDGDIIAITCSKKGLDIAHVGFAVWQENKLHLLNASMIHKKVVLEPMTLKQYLSRHPSHTGIRVIRIND